MQDLRISRLTCCSLATTAHAMSHRVFAPSCVMSLGHETPARESLACVETPSLSSRSIHSMVDQPGRLPSLDHFLHVTGSATVELSDLSYGVGLHTLIQSL